MRRLVQFALAASLAAAGCTLGPDYARPPLPRHPAYRAENPPGASIADLEWWRVFNDSVLVDLIHRALENNRDLRAALARIDQAEAQLGIARSDLYPGVVYGANGNVAVDSTGDDSTGATAFAEVSYIVDLWGRVRRSNEASLHQLLATEEAYRTLTIALVAEVATAYFQLRSVDRQLDIAEQPVEPRRHSLDIVQTRHDAGMVSEVDVRQAEIQLTAAEATVESFKLARTQTENAIGLLLGGPPVAIPRGRSIEDQELPVEAPAGVPSELVERRPDVRQAEELLAAQTARIGVAEAARFPSLTLTADLGAAVTEGVGAAFAALDANLLGPLFQAGRNKRRVELEAARTRELLAGYEQSVLNAFREVEDALAAVEANRARHDILVRQVQSAQAATDLTWARYQEGMTSFLEVLDIERSLFTSRLDATAALERYVTAVVQLYRALGGGWNPEQAVVAGATESPSS